MFRLSDLLKDAVSVVLILTLLATVVPPLNIQYLGAFWWG